MDLESDYQYVHHRHHQEQPLQHAGSSSNINSNHYGFWLKGVGAKYAQRAPFPNHSEIINENGGEIRRASMSNGNETYYSQLYYVLIISTVSITRSDIRIQQKEACWLFHSSLLCPPQGSDTNTTSLLQRWGVRNVWFVLELFLLVPVSIILEWRFPMFPLLARYCTEEFLILLGMLVPFLFLNSMKLVKLWRNLWRN
jgi:hypothetical protein